MIKFYRDNNEGEFDGSILFSVSDIEDSLRCLKSGKASGLDDLWRSSYYDSVAGHYILIWILAWSLWGQWRFENIGLNISKRRRIVTKFGTSVNFERIKMVIVRHSAKFRGESNRC